MSRFKLKGIEEMRRRIRSIADHFPQEVGRALYMEGEIEVTEMKQRTPVLTGALRASEHVEPPVISGFGGRIAVSIVAGGPSAPYAVKVHEDLEMFHPRGGEAKFMESVLMESAPHMAERVARRIEMSKLAR